MISASADSLYPGEDNLNDLSSVRFDHYDRGGNLVKFLWGVATSSYQVEGGINSNDWHIFSSSSEVRERVDSIARIGKIALHIEEPGVAVGHWDLDVFYKDVELAKSFGINAYRFSLEWSRIQPDRPPQTANVEDHGFDMEAVAHYKQMLEILVEKGMMPIVTLNHFSLPRWALTPPVTLFGNEDDGFKKSLGGWENPDTVSAFARYVRFVVGQFRDVVRYWITVNEPISIVGFGYLAGLWPPGFVGPEERARKVLFNLIEAHVQAYDTIKSLTGKGSMVGIAHGMVFPKARFDESGENVKAALQYDYCFNRYFLEAIVDGVYNPTLMHDKSPTVVERWKGKLDFVGLNYYRSAYIYKNELATLAVPWAGGIFDEDLSVTKEPHNLLNDLGWEIYPGGLYRLLKFLDHRFNLPILVSENGFAEMSEVDQLATHQERRAPYIVAHLSQIAHAINEGVDVLGYTHWSIVDNWEWDYDYLPKARFGLYTVDRKSEGKYLPRMPTGGVQALGYIIRNGAIGDAPSKFGTITPSGDMLIPPKGF